MENEIDTLAEAGTETVQPVETDTVEDWDFYDPDEDTVEEPEPEATEDDGTEAPEDPEDEPVDAEAEEPADEEAPALLDMPDGTQLERDEVVKGYLRQSDYTRKSTEVAEMRRTLDAESTRIGTIADTFVDFMSNALPPRPSHALAETNPSAYTAQLARHEAALRQVQQIVQTADEAKQAGASVNAVEDTRLVAEENRKLAERYPETANPKGRQQFFEEVAKVAQDTGFSLDELGGVKDHRLFAVLRLAAEGQKAVQSRAKAREKVEKAPPAAPNRPARGANVNSNRKAMKRLAETGSFEAAMQVDFD